MEFPVVKRLIEAINAHDLDALTATFADDFTSTWPAHPARSFDTPEQVHRNWGFVFARFPEIRISVTGSAVTADEFWGEFHYVRPGAADMRGVIIIKVRGDEIVQSRFYMEEVEVSSIPHPMPGVAGGAAGG
jgi:ketosteroid isomerase-like protein